MCLLLSGGLHGGLICHDWMASPVASLPVNAPVTVSLRPVMEVASPAVTEKTQNRPVPASRPVSSPVRAEKTEANARPHASSPGHAPATLSSRKPSESVVDMPKAERGLERTSTEIVCMLPQEFDSEPVPVSIDSDQPGIRPVTTGVTTDVVTRNTPMMSSQGEEAPSRELASSVPDGLIEATPNYRSNPLPDYPYLARQRHWEGVVWLMVNVSADGLVDDLQIIESCGHQLLDKAAYSTVGRWQFFPARRAGLPVSSQVRIPVRFRLEDG